MSTPYMSLSLPVVETTIGPDWATMLVTALTTIDSHSHVLGFGKPVPSAGVNIDADLTFAGHNATNLRSVRLGSQAAPLTGISDADCLYVSGGDLYYNNGSGQAIKLTSGGILNTAAVGGFTGDYATSSASAAYVAATSTYDFNKPDGTAAALDVGAVSIRETGVVGAKKITLQSPVALAADYAVTFPAALPGSTTPVMLSSTGVLSTQALVKAGLPAVGQVISPSSGAYGSASGSLVDVPGVVTTTIVTSGRPVFVCIQPDGTSSSYLEITTNSTSLVAMSFAICRVLTGVTTVLATFTAGFASVGAAANIDFPLNACFVDVVGAGSYTYKMQVLNTSTSAIVHATKIVAFEL